MRMGRRRVQLNSGAGYGLVLCVGCRGLLRCSDQGVAVVEGYGVSAMRREQAVAMRQPPPPNAPDACTSNRCVCGWLPVRHRHTKTRRQSRLRPSYAAPGDQETPRSWAASSSSK